MLIQYVHSHINDPEGTARKSDVSDFLLQLPTVGLVIRKARLIPPICVVNELLNAGEVDAGMSGCFEWEPIQLEPSEYELLKASLIKRLGFEFVISEQENISLKKWISLAMSQFRKNL